GLIGSFARIAGPKFAWMGAFIAFTSTAIMFYYSVVLGWTIHYFWASLTGQLSGADSAGLWEAFAFTPRVMWYHLLAMGLGVFVVARGVRGIETAARVLMPTLFLMVIVLAIRALTLDGAVEGLAFLFTPSWADLKDYNTWLQALTQNAWDTGAGWGLVLTYAIYLRQREDTALNSFLLGFGNNSVSLLAGIMVLCTVFSIMPGAASEIVGAGNEGLTFIWIPQLFQQMPAGRIFMPLFFLALMFAAWTSLISMIEMATRVLMDGGMSRGRAIAVIGGAGFVFGVPSALNQAVFQNQDFIWGVGLMVSGLFYAITVLRYGVTRFRETLINTEDADIRIGRWWDWAMRLVVVEALVLVVWWFWMEGGIAQALTGDFDGLFGTYGIGWAIVQWGLAITVFMALNRWMVARTEATAPTAEPVSKGGMPASIP